MRTDKRLIYLLFFFSGLSALVYELTWARKLSLVFGTDSYAISTVLAVFFTGLALGSWFFGKWVDKSKNPLKIYAILELGIGLYALMTPWIFKIIEALQVMVWRILSPSFSTFSIWTFVFSFVGLLLPTVLMGGTLPVVVNAAKRPEEQKVGSITGSLYAVNTLGAVFGVLASGFWLIATVGVNETIWIAAFISLIVGVIALRLSRMKTDISSPKQRAEQRGHISVNQRLVLITFGLAGFSALSLEVLWSRILILVIGGSVYAFSLVLIAFLVGIALGSIIISKFVDRVRNHLIVFAVIELLLGISVIALIPAFGQLPFWFLSIYKNFGGTFGNLQFGLWLMVVGIMIIPTLLMGAAFPVVVKAYKSSGLGDRVGKVYAVNTIGGVFGSLASGFLLIPTIGVQKGILVSGLIYLVIGLTLLFVQIRLRLVYICVLVVALIAILIGIRFKPWDRFIITAGLYTDPEYFGRIDKENLIRNLNRDDILYEAEGISAHVAVKRERDGNINLRINGKPDASTTADMENQLLLGHLPLFLHKDPKDVLVVGLGSGITLGSVLTHPVEHVDVVEIEEKVVEAAKFFNDYSNNALADPRTKITVGDGRYLLLVGDKKYDVISSEPSNPWLSGSSKLFTKEYFAQLKNGIKDDGVVLHWINLYSLDVSGLKTILKAFREVSPQMVVFAMPASNDLVLIGSNQKLEFVLNDLEESLTNKMISSDLAKVKISHPYEILAYFALDEKAVDNIVQSTTPNTDNHPVVEFSAPKALYLPLTINPWRVILDNLTPVDTILADQPQSAKKSVVISDAEAFRRSRLLTQINWIERNIGKGIEEGEKALAIDSENPFLEKTLARLYFEDGSSFLNQGDYSYAVKSFERSLELYKTAESYVNLGLSLRQLGDLNSAIEAFEKAHELETENVEALLNLGNLYIMRKDFGKAEGYLNSALEVDPNLQEARELLRAIP